jgi:steroid delta-isomerase-like uncharacterized protein
MPSLVELVRAHIEAEDRRDVQATLDTFSDDCFYTMHAFGLDLRGKEQIGNHYRNAFKAMPNFHNPESRIIDAGDDVFWIGRMEAIQTGPWGDLPATGRKVVNVGLAHFPRGSDGRLAGEHTWFNGNDFLHQLGLLPSSNSMELVRHIKTLESRLARLRARA